MKCKGLFGSFLIVRTFTYIVGWASSRGPGLGFLLLAQSYEAKQPMRRMRQPVECPKLHNVDPTKGKDRTLRLLLDCFIVTILEGAEVRIGFYGQGGRDPPRGHFRGCQRPRGVSPSLIPTHKGSKTFATER